MKIIPNPDKEKYLEATKAVEQNNGYCPCALIKSEDTRCICKGFRVEAKSGYKGECECGRYVAL